MNALDTCTQLVAELNSIDPNYFARQLSQKPKPSSFNLKGKPSSPAQRKSWMLSNRKSRPSSLAQPGAGDPPTAAPTPLCLDPKQQASLDLIVQLRRWLATVLFHPTATTGGAAAGEDGEAYRSQTHQTLDLLLQCAKQQQIERFKLKNASGSASHLSGPSTANRASSSSSSRRFNQLVRKFSSTKSTTSNWEDGEGEDVDGGEEEYFLDDVEDPTLALTVLADLCGIQTCLAVIDPLVQFDALVQVCNDEFATSKSSLRLSAASRCLANLSKRPSFLAKLCEPIKLGVDQLPKQAHVFQFGLDSTRFPTTLRVLLTLSSQLASKQFQPTSDEFFALLTKVLDSVFDYGDSFHFLLERKEQEEFQFHVRQVCELMWKLMLGAGKHQKQYGVCFTHAITVWASITQRGAECLQMRKQFVDKFLVPNLAQLEVQGLATYWLEFEAKHDQVYPPDDLAWREQTLKRLFPALLHMKTVPQCFVQWLASAIKLQPDYLCEEWIPDTVLANPSHAEFGLVAMHDVLLTDSTFTLRNGKAVADKLTRFMEAVEVADVGGDEEDEVLGRLRFPVTRVATGFGPQEDREAKLALLVIPLLPVLMATEESKESGTPYELVATFSLHPNAAISSCALDVLASAGSSATRAIADALDQAEIDSVRTNNLLAVLDGLGGSSISSDGADSIRGAKLFHSLAVVSAARDRASSVEGAEEEGARTHARVLARSRLRPLLRSLLAKPPPATTNSGTSLVKMNAKLNRELFGTLNVLCATTQPEHSIEFTSVFADLLSHEQLNAFPNWAVNRIVYALGTCLPPRCEALAANLLPPFTSVSPPPLRFLCVLDAILLHHHRSTAASGEGANISQSGAMLLALFFDQLAVFKQQGGVEVHTCFLRLVDLFVREMNPTESQLAVVLKMIQTSPFKSNSVRICVLRSLSSRRNFPLASSSSLGREWETELIQEMEVNRNCAVEALENVFRRNPSLETGINFGIHSLQHDVYLLAFLRWYEQGKAGVENGGEDSKHLKTLLLVLIWLTSSDQRGGLLGRFFHRQDLPENDWVCAQRVAALCHEQLGPEAGLDVIQQCGNLLAMASKPLVDQDLLMTLMLACAETVGDFGDKTRLFNVVWKCSVHVSALLQCTKVLSLWKSAVGATRDHTELFAIFLTLGNGEEELATRVWEYIAPSAKVTDMLGMYLDLAVVVSPYQSRLLLVSASRMLICAERDELFGYLMHVACYEPALMGALTQWKQTSDLLALVVASPAAKKVALEACQRRMRQVNCEASAMLAIQLSQGDAEVLVEAVRISERSLRQRASSVLLQRLLVDFPAPEQKPVFAILVGVCLQFTDTRRQAYELLQRHRFNPLKLQQGFSMATGNYSFRFLASARENLSWKEIRNTCGKLAFHPTVLRVLDLVLGGDEEVVAADAQVLETCASLLVAQCGGEEVKPSVYKLLACATVDRTQVLLPVLAQLAMEDFARGMEQPGPFLLKVLGVVQQLQLVVAPSSQTNLYPAFSKEEISKALFGWKQGGKEEEPVAAAVVAEEPLVKATKPKEAEIKPVAAPSGFISLQELVEKKENDLEEADDKPEIVFATKDLSQRRKQSQQEQDARTTSDLDQRRKQLSVPATVLDKPATPPLASPPVKRPPPPSSLDAAPPKLDRALPVLSEPKPALLEPKPALPEPKPAPPEPKLNLEGLKSTLLDHPEMSRPKIPSGKRRNPSLTPSQFALLDEEEL
ncbi:hypothetical protein BASA81_007509 [Batrachochytrium salamandrivorans]|nr:hypothetical protein BASA81_007509 [Batrachochytrium salamandrivorans]